jgi:hypothetical protein
MANLPDIILTSEHISGVSFVSVQRGIKDANDSYGFIF